MAEMSHLYPSLWYKTYIYDEFTNQNYFSQENEMSNLLNSNKMKNERIFLYSYLALASNYVCMTPCNWNIFPMGYWEALFT